MTGKIGWNVLAKLAAEESRGKHFDVSGLLAKAKNGDLNISNALDFAIGNAIKNGENFTSTKTDSQNTTDCTYQQSDNGIMMETATTTTKTTTTTTTVKPVTKKRSNTSTRTQTLNVDTGKKHIDLLSETSSDGKSTQGTSVASVSNSTDTWQAVSSFDTKAQSSSFDLESTQDLRNLYCRYISEVETIRKGKDPCPLATWSLMHEEDYAKLKKSGLLANPPPFCLEDFEYHQVSVDYDQWNRVAVLGENRFEVDYGHRMGSDTNGCFYLSITEGDQKQATKLKKRLAPYATKYSKTLGLRDDFSLSGKCADLEIIFAFVHIFNKPLCIVAKESGRAMIVNKKGSPNKNFIFLHLRNGHFTRLYRDI